MKWYESALCSFLDLLSNAVKTAFVFGMLLFWIVCIAFIVGLFQ